MCLINISIYILSTYYMDFTYVKFYFYLLHEFILRKNTDITRPIYILAQNKQVQ